MPGGGGAIKGGFLVECHGAGRDLAVNNHWPMVAHAVQCRHGLPLFGIQGTQGPSGWVEMLLTCESFTKICRSENRQRISDQGRDGSRERLQSNRIIEPSGRLQIELGRSAGQDRLAA